MENAAAPTTRASAQNSSLLSLFVSSVGRKAIMAATGAVLFSFVVGHLLGNLQVYLGPQVINAYAEKLHSVPPVLWMVRCSLMFFAALHLWAATTLTLDNWRARPIGYRRQEDVASTYASRTMIWSGPLLGLFLAYHLMHLTIGSAHPDFIPKDVYHNLITGFRVPLVSAFYALAVMAVGLHIYHGVYSLLQSLGVNHPRLNPLRRPLAWLVAAAIVAGNLSFPIAVLTGVLR
ncbi:MAG: succinate dehydrogenase cytochrome b subunit [Vicinamibacteria bacterium]|nr:succinate dehydrogenase cytochrome b subunit [Vicinamibacteria bacterium]